MKRSNAGLRALVVAVTGATAASLAMIPTASAAVDGSNVVINEVYGGGGNSGATLTNDFIELYNPTDQEIDLTGMSVEYFSAAGGSGGGLELNGVIAPGGHFLINMASGSGGSVTAEADATGSVNMSGSNGAVRLFDATGTEIDLIGFGSASDDRVEGSATPSLSNTTSAQRVPEGNDTDNNAADFVVGAPSPTNAAGVNFGEVAPGEPGDPGVPVNPVDPDEIRPIAEIQGVGPQTPRLGQTVSTQGVVTGVYSDGGRNGFYLQTPGTGGEEQTAEDASHGIFVYLGTGASASDYPEINDSLTVTGQAAEYQEVTQLTNPAITVEAEELAPVEPVAIEHLPAGDAAREAYESMLVQPTGDYTVSNNYQLNTFGEVGLAPGTEAFRQGTDVLPPSTDPNSPVQQLMAEQAEQEVLLDDGRTPNYMNDATDVPLPYIAQDDATTIKPLRTGDTVDFQNPVVVHYSHDFWRFQPTEPVTGDTAGTDLPIDWENSRDAEIGAMDQVGGEFSAATFNVLNYFTTLGHTENGCGYYEDIYGNPVATDWCDVRGAYSESAFDDQQTKIVNAINQLDASVVSLEEIENTASITGNPADRDEALGLLVEALNTAAGGDKWAFVPSPDEVGIDEDVIRNAFIYQPAEVQTVGQSRIFNDPAYTGIARQPLAQEFAPADADPTAEHTDTFVAVTNHFKSKGSVVRGDGDQGDGQANNPNVRNTQSQALLEHLNAQEDWAGTPTFILGDINSYSRETAMSTLINGGYTNIIEVHDDSEPTYQFSGRLGSLDHALGNDEAMNLVEDAAVWNINADETIAFEYSRRNYNVVDFHDDSPFRSSDHDPIKVGFNLTGDVEPGEPSPEEPMDPAPGETVASMTVNAAGHLIVTYTDGVELDLGPVVGEDGADGDGIQTVEIIDGELVVTLTDGTELNLGEVTGADGQDGSNGEDGRGVESMVIDDEGNLIVTYTDGEEVNLGNVTGEDGQDGSNGDDGSDGQDGNDGRAVAATEINDSGHLIITYTDGTTEDLGRIIGQDGADGTDGADGQDGQDSANGSSDSFLSSLLGVVVGALGMVGIVGLLGNFFPQIQAQINTLINNFR